MEGKDQCNLIGSCDDFHRRVIISIRQLILDQSISDHQGNEYWDCHYLSLSKYTYMRKRYYKNYYLITYLIISIINILIAVKYLQTYKVNDCIRKSINSFDLVYLLVVTMIITSLCACSMRERNVIYSMKALGLTLGSYMITNNTLPVDNRGEDYALYKIREVMMSDEYATRATKLFDWDHASKKIIMSRIHYLNKNVNVFTDQPGVLLILSDILYGHVYALDSNYIVYMLTLNKNDNFNAQEHLGKPLHDMTNIVNIISKEEVPLLKKLYDDHAVKKDTEKI